MFHKEGYVIIVVAVVLTTLGVLLTENYVATPWIRYVLYAAIVFFLVIILQFFRNPKRIAKLENVHVLAPVDGKVVVIEEVLEKEFFNKKMRQVSIFMSPINVHVTRYPSSGKIVYSKHHKGKYLVAWHPKASEENERTTVVVETEEFGPILYRQIAGALAKRIVNYAREGDMAVQGEDSGFIKFGSRVDVFLPLDVDIKVSLNQKVKGAVSVIASI